MKWASSFKDSSLKDKIEIVVDRALKVATVVLESVEDGSNCENALRRYFNSTITTEDDFRYYGKPLFAGEMCDDMLLQAGMSTLGPHQNFVFLGTATYVWINRSLQEYENAAKEKGKFRYDVEFYNILLKATSRFKSIPTIILPVSQSLHWGYAVVIPEPDSGSTVIMWGDSLRMSPPSGLLEFFRLYLLLLYRDVRFVISSLNHTIDVLGFSRQQDGFSCGFYVLASMYQFSTASTDKHFPACRFKKYDANVTEQYRQVCIRSMVLHIMWVNAASQNVQDFGALEVSKSFKNDCREPVDAANKGVLEMYPEEPVDKVVLLRWQNSCNIIEGATVIADDGKLETASGLVSTIYEGEGDKPFISTISVVPGVISLSFSDVMDFHTIWNPKCFTQRIGNSAKLSVQPKAADKTSTGPDKPDTDMLSAKPFSSSACRIPQVFPTSEGDPNSHSSLHHEGRTGTSIVVSEIVANGLTDGENTEEACYNIFAYLTQRLSEGHLLRKPEYQQYKGIDYRFRLRLRCRFYDPEPKWAWSIESYQRCPVRLYARVLKNQGGWRLSFRHRYNHEIWTHARLGPEDIFKRMSAFKKSLGRHYDGADSEFDSWKKGDRFSGHCPAVDGVWEVATAPTDICIRTDIKAPDPMSSDRTATETYMNIAPRPKHELPPQERSHLPVQLVSSLGVTGSFEANLRLRAVTDSDLIPLSVEYTDTLRKYVQSCVATCDGRDVKDELKYLSECFGFPMVVRTSKYFHDGVNENQTGSQVRRLTFKCPVGENNKLRKECKYWFTVVSSASNFVELNRTRGVVDEETLWRPLVINFRENWHTHKSDEGALRRCLPAEIWREAIDLKDKSLIDTADIARYVEDKYNLRLNRRVLSRRLRWEMGKRHPAERDCLKLISNLMRYTQTNPGMFCEARVNDDNALHSICWGFPRWAEEYKQFGVIPGVTIDSKDLANNYDTPLSIICGRTNNRAVTIFFMGFLASQREDEFLWFVGCFKKFVTVAPRLVACDQDSAIINSLEKVFPSTMVILDDWHLSKNQLKNTASLAKELGPEVQGKEISTALWGLRQARTEMEFLKRRRQFEEHYLRDRVFPRWYNSLYHTNYKLVVLCYNRSTCGERFLFQGSGYAEAANSQKRFVIMEKKINMARVPEEVLRYMEKRLFERKENMRTIKFLGQMASLFSFATGVSPGDMGKGCGIVRTFCLGHCNERIYIPRS